MGAPRGPTLRRGPPSMVAATHERRETRMIRKSISAWALLAGLATMPQPAALAGQPPGHGVQAQQRASVPSWARAPSSWSRT
jgi:hypothetical protein